MNKRLISSMLASSFILMGASSALTLNASAQEAKGKSSTVESSTETAKYARSTFRMLPASQLKSRLPVDKAKAGRSASGTTNLQGKSGAIGDNATSGRSFGTSLVPYSSTKALRGFKNPARANPNRRSGKLYMAFGGNTYNYVCSASLIGKSLVVTAAHCVHDFGKRHDGWARKVMFVPAKHYGDEPYGQFESSSYLIPTSYWNGTDTCTQAGVVCNNDVALVHLRNNAKRQQAGVVAGYNNYGWNGYSFAQPAPAYQGVFSNKVFASITQLGYPVSHDSGLRMQINTAYGAPYFTGDLRNTWLGSSMTGGSSGGPWIVNYGAPAAGANYGSHAVRNVITGVTSYGNGQQRQGASWFGQNKEFPNAAYGTRGAGNIGKLVYDACDNPALTSWMLQSKGRCR